MKWRFLHRSSWLLLDLMIAFIKQVTVREIDVKKIKLTILYIQTVDTLRKLYRSVIFGALGAIFFINTISLCQLAILLYAPWELSSRIFAAIGLGFVAFSVPILLMLRSFSEETWMQGCKGDEALEFAIGKSQLRAAKEATVSP